MKTVVQQLEDNIIALHIPNTITDDEIESLIRQCMPECQKTQQGCVCSIWGYDADDRELYQIPEVTVLCKRFVDLGLISIMHVSSLMDKEEKPYISRFFGAMEIWAVATGALNAEGDLTIDEPQSKQFLADLDKANKRAGILCCPTIKDGQHRTRVV